SLQLQFRGKDATECEDFISAIVKRAFAQGKQRDDQWMADFAANCMVNDAMRWWSKLDEEVQGSWKLLRRAMLSRYRQMFHGGSGEEVEKFIRAVCDEAIDEGKEEDNKWIVAYASSCLAGEALRWYAYLGSDTKSNWEKLQQALLTQYPRGASAGPVPNLVPTPPAAASVVPPPNVTRRGRIRVSNGRTPIAHYLSKRLSPENRVTSTYSIADALQLDWNTSPDGVQTLSIPGSQILGHDLLGVKWTGGDRKAQAKSAPPAPLSHPADPSPVT
ncbi:hypothetical protein FRC01_005272, partial [Tulasnella sp. 417]